MSAAQDDTHCYTVASLNGTYGVVGDYGAHVAIALATRHFDGKGNLTGTFTINAPDPASTTGGRKLITGTQMGTYTVNCDGTGVFDRVLTSNGTIVHQFDDFIITVATAKDGQLIATTIEDAQTCAEDPQCARAWWYLSDSSLHPPTSRELGRSSSQR
jgi:hypothetical protein